MRPTVSCVCITHGRAHFVNEALESFLRQEFKGFTAELLIYVDCPEQIIECDLPNVRVINYKDPIPDVSLKYTKAINEALGEYIAWWEDDDISLPFRLQYSMDKINKSSQCCYKQNLAWVWNFGEITHLSGNLFFGNSLFSRDAYIKSGGAVEGIAADASSFDAIVRECGCNVEITPPEELYFIYRWGGMGQHDSGIGGTNLDRFQSFRKGTLSNPLFVPGVVKLNPKWNQDYSKMAKEAVEKQKSRP